MRRCIAVLALATFLVGASLQSAKAEGLSTETLAYTFVLALAGTAAGAAVMPVVAPMAAPAVAGAYATTAGAVNGALVGFGSLIMLEPRSMGAVLGMGAGLMSGLYFFGD
ncbi:MAG: hypothetical protein NXI19_08465 [Alphaproteobacteria bacterium]|nr:hypothetical protein [Alphaproteobacteria bacterium]